MEKIEYDGRCGGHAFLQDKIGMRVKSQQARTVTAEGNDLMHDGLVVEFIGLQGTGSRCKVQLPSQITVGRILHKRYEARKMERKHPSFQLSFFRFRFCSCQNRVG